MQRKQMTLLASIMIFGVACDLPKGDMTSPYYWGEVFLNKYADELVVGELEEGPEPLEESRVVLLITGVTIPGEWFDPIIARLERDGFEPHLYVPPELLSYDLFQASEDLDAVVDDLLEKSGQDKIDILAECTGGVIARHYIQSLGGDEKVSRMVTFVSPQKGVAKAPWAALIAGWPALHDLSPGSEFLQAVNNAPLPQNVPITSIYTCSDEYIQPYTTSIIEGADNIGLCDGFVGHFQTFYNPEIYLIMHGALTEPTPSELAAAQEPEAQPEPAVEPEPEQVNVPETTPETPTPGTEPAADPVEELPGDEGIAEPSIKLDPASDPAAELPFEPAQAANESPKPNDGTMQFLVTPPNGAGGCTSGGSGSGAPASAVVVLLSLVALAVARRRGLWTAAHRV